MREPNEIDMMRGRLILAQWASYVPSGYRSCWPTVAQESLSPLNRFEAHCTVDKWLQFPEFDGLHDHLRAWYKANQGRAHESASEPEPLREMRHEIEKLAAKEVIQIESETF